MSLRPRIACGFCCIPCRLRGADGKIVLRGRVRDVFSGATYGRETCPLRGELGACMRRLPTACWIARGPGILRRAREFGLAIGPFWTAAAGVRGGIAQSSGLDGDKLKHEESAEQMEKDDGRPRAEARRAPQMHHDIRRRLHVGPARARANPDSKRDCELSAPPSVRWARPLGRWSIIDFSAEPGGAHKSIQSQAASASGGADGICICGGLGAPASLCSSSSQLGRPWAGSV
ncbi:uncharacterized protein BXZ73DRAFT_75138 [Epithele typhae]|uniref:uncharacterized protein n=1 Tax=Epithele typhae TaxID=378194 RepID=UPI0020087F2E|nr:uncharacterized protein BXZ73DRAFT_75138 [Epithele typhae]KAH9941171.1 hypothetical protein BXZ73DRAFT_75138 [Epithele typhae]